jgi:predicted  nucleic acid-binding Zn-ribbon protein
VEATVSTPNRREFRSPKRILVRFFKKSRDRWKEKYQEAKRELKRLANQAADVRRSREAWRKKAEEAEAEVQRLQGQLQAERTAQQDAGKKGAPRAL